MDLAGVIVLGPLPFLAGVVVAWYVETEPVTALLYGMAVVLAVFGLSRIDEMWIARLLPSVVF